MKKIAAIGNQIIHTYAYFAHLNGCEKEILKKHCKPWMLKFMLDQDLSPKTDAMRITSVWSADDEENRRLAETFGIEHVCASADEAIEGADSVMILDEGVESRSALIEKCIRAGIDCWADKLLASDARKAEQLIHLAEQKGVRVRTWSQLYFCPEWQAIRNAEPGGMGFLSYQVGPQALDTHAVHPVFILLAAFGSGVRSYRPLSDAGERMTLLQMENGTRLFLYLGGDTPSGGRIDYRTKDAAVLAQEGNMGVIFESAARALIDFFSGGTPACGHPEMVEAIRLLECVLRGGSDGKEILIEN